MEQQESRNVRTVREIARAVSGYDFDAVARHLHDELVIECPFPAFFQGPLRRGGAQVAAGFAFIPQIFKSFKLDITEIYDCPEQDVVVFEQTSQGEFLSGARYANRYVMIFGFRDGKVVLWRECFDPIVMNAGMAPLLAHM
jgi:ketosteroid isomerase-like protein